MEEEPSIDAVQQLIPEVVRQAYAEEEQFIARKVEAARKAGASWIQELLTWVPYVDAVFQEDEIGVSAATSDVNRDVRTRLVISKIEQGLGFSLDDETKANIRTDVWQMYDPRTDSDE